MPPDNEEIPYRAPINIGVADPVSSEDEQDFSTLLYLQKEINTAVNNLKSISVFDLKAEGGLTVEQQIVAYRKALELVAPLQNTINSTVGDIKLKQKEGK